MDYKEQIYKELSSRRYFRLKQNLNLIYILEFFETKGTCPDSLPQDVQKNIKELATCILSKQYNRYSENDQKSSKNPFKDKDFAEKDLYTQIAYFVAAKRFSMEKSITLEELSYFAENTDWGFWIGLQFSYDRTCKLIELSCSDITRVLLGTRNLELRGNELADFCKTELPDHLSDDEIIKRINYYNDGSYTELPAYVSVLSHVCLREGYWDLWSKLLSGLKYFPLQGAVINHIQDLKTLLKTTEIIDKEKTKHYKVIAFLLRNRSLDVVSNTIENLVNNKNDTTLDCQYRSLSFDLIDTFLSNRKEYTNEFVNNLIDSLGTDNISQWIANEENRLINAPSFYLKIQRSFIRLLKEAFINGYDEIADFASLDFPTLCIEAEVAYKKKYSKENCCELTKALCNSIFNSDYLRDVGLDENTLGVLRNIYKILIMSKLDPLYLSDSYFKPIEGYCVKYDESHKYHQRLSIWYSIILLSIEETKDLKLFREVVNRMLDDVMFLQLAHEDYVSMPFYIAELIVTQILTHEKTTFEKLLIDRVPYLPLVLRVMSANNGIMDVQVKKELNQRIDVEWTHEKAIIGFYNKKLTKLLDEYVDMIK